jgi:hypothetical protein
MTSLTASLQQANKPVRETGKGGGEGLRPVRGRGDQRKEKHHMTCKHGPGLLSDHLPIGRNIPAQFFVTEGAPMVGGRGAWWACLGWEKVGWIEAWRRVQRCIVELARTPRTPTLAAPWWSTSLCWHRRALRSRHCTCGQEYRAGPFTGVSHTHTHIRL